MNNTGVLIAVTLAVVLVMGLGFYLACLPGKIARERKHPNTDAINLCGLIGLFIWPCWVIALIWAHSKSALPRGEAARPLTPRQTAKLKAAEALMAMNEPAEPPPLSYADICAAAAKESGSGRFRIVGVVRETGGDVTTYVEAATPDNAKVKAELRGIVVTSVEHV